ncbi:MAG: lipoyl protein ligase domain-containing protein [Bacteroidales bacterium]
MEVHEYMLPDKKLIETDVVPAAFLWQPDEVYVVLGRSNQPDDSVFLERLEEDGVVLLKRPSGGETVVLTPRMLVIACTWPLDTSNSSTEIFRLSNQIVMKVLDDLGVEGLNQKGISDISLGDLKIAGSAMHRARDRWFYHAVLNVGEPTGTISWYLKHPRREPDYRKGRPHNLFVTSLWEAGYPLTMEELLLKLSEAYLQKEFSLLT